MNSSALPLLAVLAGALAGAGLFVFIAAVRGLPPKAKSQGPSALERAIKDMFSIRGAIAIIVGILTLLITRWVVAGIGWRAWPPGRSRCATRSPARSGSSRPSPPRPGSPTPRSASR